MDDDLVSRTVELPSGPLSIRQPRDSAELPDDGAIEWAPIAPYWSVLWRSGVALARAVDRTGLACGLRVVELGCGLGLPSIAAARRGATVLATDGCPEALALLSLNAAANRVAVATAAADWATAGEPLRRAPFDLVLAADVLYEPAAVGPLLSLLPSLAPEAWIADPGRPAAEGFLEQAGSWAEIETRIDGVVAIHRLRVRRAGG